MRKVVLPRRKITVCHIMEKMENGSVMHLKRKNAVKAIDNNNL
jgi:hypothetical protein